MEASITCAFNKILKKVIDGFFFLDRTKEEVTFFFCPKKINKEVTFLLCVNTLYFSVTSFYTKVRMELAVIHS